MKPALRVFPATIQDECNQALVRQRSEDELQHVGNWLCRPAWFEESGVLIADLEDREARLVHQTRSKLNAADVADASNQREAIADLIEEGKELETLRLRGSQTVRNRLDELAIERGEIGRESVLSQRIRQRAATQRLELQARRFAHDVSSISEFDALLFAHNLCRDLRAVNQIDPGLTTLAAVKPEPIEWLWGGYIPRGKITDIVGDGDLGKSLVLLDIAARVTTGRPMPSEAAHLAGPPRDVVLLLAEDDLADTVAPRLIAAGADMDRVHAFEDGIAFPEDVGRVEEAIRRYSAALLIIDPIMSFLGERVKSGIDSSVRNAIGTPLKDIASRTGCAVASLRHANKNMSTSAANRGGGSVAFRNMARAALAFGPDRDDESESRRFMAQAKKNLGGQAETLAYRIEASFGRVEIEGVEGTPIVVWEGAAHGVTASDLLGPPPAPGGPRAGSKTAQATTWLQDRLAAGVGVKSTVILEEMESAGFSKTVIDSAKKHAGVRAERISTDGSGHGNWLWVLG